MDAQEFRSLQEAYMEVVENKQYDKTHGGATQKGPIGTGIGKDLNIGFEKRIKEKQAKSKIKKEQVDIYDIILSHLLDEGYAETPEAAEAIMVNMSEEWRDSIIG